MDVAAHQKKKKNKKKTKEKMQQSRGKSQTTDFGESASCSSAGVQRIQKNVWCGESPSTPPMFGVGIWDPREAISHFGQIRRSRKHHHAEVIVDWCGISRLDYCCFKSLRSYQ